jgi:hypothetical protein
MARFVAVVQCAPDVAFAAVLATAELQGFKVIDRTGTESVALQYGTFWPSLAYGASSLYCKLKLDLAAEGECATRLVLAWRWYWWQGIPGYLRNRKLARQFLDDLAAGLRSVTEANT